MNKNAEEYQFLVGGYILAMLAETRPDYVLLPEVEMIVSLDPDLMDMVHRLWSLGKPDISLVSRLEIDPSSLRKIIDVTGNDLINHKIEYPGIFMSLKDARMFAKSFLNNSPNLWLLEIAIEDADSKLFLSDEMDPNGKEPWGVVKVVKNAYLPEENGKFLGFDIVGLDYDEFNSWLTREGLELYRRENELHLNRFGLIQSISEAKRVAEYSNLHCNTIWTNRWLPWMITRYSL